SPLVATAILLAAGAAMPAQAEPTPGAPPSAANANCRNTGSFERWLASFRQEATANGISRAAIASALDGMTLDQGIIARARRQRFSPQSSQASASKLISPNRIQNGMARLKQHHDLLTKVEREFGVQGPVIVAFWALESDYGVAMGNLPVLRSLAALAYD